MIYRVKLEGTITVYSEETLDRITKLAEDEELFNYLSTLINTGSETNEVLKKLELLLSGRGQMVNQLPSAFLPQREATSGSGTIQNTTQIPNMKISTLGLNAEPLTEKTAPPISGSASTILERMRKVNKKT